MSKQPKTKAEVYSSFKEATKNYKLPAYMTPGMFGEEGEDHINLSISSKTRLGRILDPFCTHLIEHPTLGNFNSAMALIYWLKEGGMIDSLRFLELADIKSLSYELKNRAFPHYDAVVLYTSYLKVKRYPNLVKEIKNMKDLSLLSYVINRRSNLRMVTPTAEKLVNITTELFAAIREDRTPNYGLFLARGETIDDCFVFNKALVKKDAPKPAKPTQEALAKLETDKPKKKRKKRLTGDERKSRDKQLHNNFLVRIKKLGAMKVEDGVALAFNFKNLFEFAKVLDGNVDSNFLKFVTVEAARDLTKLPLGDDRVLELTREFIATKFTESELNSIRRLSKTYGSYDVLYESDVSVKTEGTEIKVKVGDKDYTVNVDPNEPDEPKRQNFLLDAKVTDKGIEVVTGFDQAAAGGDCTMVQTMDGLMPTEHFTPVNRSEDVQAHIDQVLDADPVAPCNEDPKEEIKE